MFSSKSITILKANTSAPKSSSESTIISFEELKKWIKNGSFIKHLFRYQKVTLITCRLNSLPKPFLTALLLMLMCRGECIWRDEVNHHKKITFKPLINYFFNFIRDLIKKNKLIKNIDKEVSQLLERCKKPSTQKELSLNKQPIYLRTDLVFGLKSGGSVGHISGVLNNIDTFSQTPLFLSSDTIPTVRSDIKTHIISPKNNFWDFPDVPTLAFNDKFYQSSDKLLTKNALAFIYQRYSTNNFSGVKLASKYNIPFVLEYNGSEIWINRHWGKPLKYEALSEKIEILNLRYADLIVVVSLPMKQELISRGIPKEKILVNPNGVNPKMYSPDINGDEIRKKLNIEKYFVFGFIGTFGKWHGSENLIESFNLALKQFPILKEKAKLLMIGDGAQKAIAESLAKSHGIENSVLFTGLVPQEIGPQYLAACDTLVSPHVPNPDGSPFFGSPTKLFEYMAMGKPIIASNLDQIGEILSHKETAYLVPPGDANALAKALHLIFNDRDLCQSLERATRQAVVNQYTWQLHTKKIIERLKEIVV